MIRRRGTALLIVGLIVVAIQLATRPVAAAGTYPSVLGTGKTLGSVGILESSSGEFDLSVSGGDLVFQQSINVGPNGGVGEALWHIKAYADPPPRLEHAKLTMQRNGNLVFRDGLGAIIWQTHTAGTGHRNRLVVQDNGRFVVRRGDGDVVWRSPTNPVLFAPGSRLRAGQVLQYRQSRTSARTTRLTVGAGGRLLLRVNRTLVWATRVSVPGSYLYLRFNGDLVLLTPAGRAVWQSHTAPGRLYLMMCDGAFAVRNLSGAAPLFIRPASASC